MTPAETLRAAADLIEAGEWASNADLNIVNSMARTISGAIAHVSPDIATALRATGALSRALGLDGVATWERAFGRTQAEVVDALRAAAAAAEAAS